MLKITKNIKCSCLNQGSVCICHINAVQVTQKKQELSCSKPVSQVVTSRSDCFLDDFLIRFYNNNKNTLPKLTSAVFVKIALMNFMKSIEWWPKRCNIQQKHIL